jgi:hypothetical protein
MNRYLIQIALDGVFLGSLYTWQVNGSQGAGNIFLFMAWALAILGLLLMFTPRASLKDKPKPKVIALWNRVKMTAIIFIIAYLGMFVLASLLALAMCILWAKTKEEK